MFGNPLVPDKTAFTVCLYGGVQVLLQCVVKLLQQMKTVGKQTSVSIGQVKVKLTLWGVEI